MPNTDAGRQASFDFEGTRRPDDPGVGCPCDGMGTFGQWRLDLQDREAKSMMVGHKSGLVFRERIAEWGAAAMLFLMGVQLLRPYDTFKSPVFQGLANIATENHWGMIMVVLGTARLFVLYVNGMWLPSYRLRSAFAFLSVFIWTQLTVGIFWANDSAILLAILPVLLFTDGYAIQRAITDYRFALALKQASHAGPDPT